MIIAWLKQKKSIRAAAEGLYQSAVTQSRDPRFYAELGVSDTLDGRFDMISLHVFLILERLKTEKGGKKLAQALFDHMFKSMDETLREIGVGDLSVPKHMQRMMKAFNGRVHSYHAAINDNNMQDLELAVVRNIYRTEGQPAPYAHLMAQYISNAANGLMTQDFDSMGAGRVSFPPLPMMKQAHA